MVVSSPRIRASLTLALALPAVSLAATTCGGSLPSAPSAAPSEPPPHDASTSSWALPAVPLAEPRRIIFLERPPGAPDASAIAPIAPDPPPLVERGQWVYDLRWDKGDLLLAGVHKVVLTAPRATPRVMGRFALELYTGPTLLERVRFDFPGLGVALVVRDGGAQPIHGAEMSLTRKLSTRVGVMLPATDRGTRLEIWDRATNQRWPLPWPATELTTADATDASPLH